MGMLPAIPSWDALHPFVIHFPIALLLVAPVLIVVSLFVKSARPWAIAALTVMALGTLASFVSVSTGEAAGELAERGGAVAKSVIEQHEEMAEATRNVFTALTLVFSMLVLAPALTRKPLTRLVSVVTTVIFLALYTGGALVLVNTAHQGGRLVHEFGVRAALAPSNGSAPTVAAHPAAGAAGGEHERGERD
jgi:uncharacterized membrane protein